MSSYLDDALSVEKDKHFRFYQAKLFIGTSISEDKKKEYNFYFDRDYCVFCPICAQTIGCGSGRRPQEIKGHIERQHYRSNGTPLKNEAIVLHIN